MGESAIVDCIYLTSLQLNMASWCRFAWVWGLLWFVIPRVSMFSLLADTQPPMWTSQWQFTAQHMHVPATTSISIRIV